MEDNLVADWQCPECEAIQEAWSYLSLATMGGPICEACDCDMLVIVDSGRLMHPQARGVA